MKFENYKHLLYVRNYPTSVLIRIQFYPRTLFGFGIELGFNSLGTRYCCADMWTAHTPLCVADKRRYMY